jgi:hypothetical protein
MTIVTDHAIDNPALATPSPHGESLFFHGAAFDCPISSIAYRVLGR